MIQEVSSLKEVMVPGRVEEALQVHRNSPLRVFASERKGIVLGGCSPVNRLKSLTKVCTSDLSGALNYAIYVASASRIVTTTKGKGGRLRRVLLDTRLARIFRREGAILGGDNSTRFMTVAGSEDRCDRRVVDIVLDRNSVTNKIVFLRGGRGGRFKRVRGGFTSNITSLLKERLDWGHRVFLRKYVR